jgi:hypothetical protein
VNLPKLSLQRLSSVLATVTLTRHAQGVESATLVQNLLHTACRWSRRQQRLVPALAAGLGEGDRRVRESDETLACHGTDRFSFQQPEA